MRVLFLAVAVAALSSAATAQKTNQKFTTSNGVIVNVMSDSFAGRKEVSSPGVDFTPDGGGKGTAIVGLVRDRGESLGLSVQGFVIYQGDWRFYSSAIFRGGVPAKFKRLDGDVISCGGSRYSRGCTMSETFILELTPEDLAKYGEAGQLQFRISGKGGQTATVSVPLTYFAAVQEAAP